MAGRIGVYVHSDSVTPDKGACLVLVSTDTDFASRTAEVKEFANKIAQHAYGASIGFTRLTFKEVCDMFPDLENERAKLSVALKESVAISEIQFMKVL